MATNFNDFNRKLIQNFREHAGRVSEGPFVGRDVLLLTTRGARSGEERTMPLVYTRDGDRLIVVASKGGAPSHPAWYHNLVANPVVTVEVGPERFSARAQVVYDEGEYERLYGQHASVNPTFNDYRRKTSRRIPVIALERNGH